MNKIIIYFQIAIILILSFITYQKEQQNKSLFIQLDNLQAKTDSIKNHGNNIYSKYAKQQAILPELKKSKDSLAIALKNEIEKHRQSAIALVQARAEWRTKQVEILKENIIVKSKPDTIYKHRRLKINFRQQIQNIDIAGKVYYPPGRVFIQLKRNPINVNVMITKTTAGHFRTYVQTDDPYLKINKINSKINIEELPAKTKFFVPYIEAGWMYRDGILVKAGIEIKQRIRVIFQTDKSSLNYGGVIRLWNRR